MKKTLAKPKKRLMDDRPFDKHSSSSLSFIQCPRQSFQTRKISHSREVSITLSYLSCLAAARPRESSTANHISFPIHAWHMGVLLAFASLFNDAVCIFSYIFSSFEDEYTADWSRYSEIITSSRSIIDNEQQQVRIRSISTSCRKIWESVYPWSFKWFSSTRWRRRCSDGNRLSFVYKHNAWMFIMFTTLFDTSSASVVSIREPNVFESFIEGRSRQVEEEDESILKCSFIGKCSSTIFVCWRIGPLISLLLHFLCRQTISCPSIKIRTTTEAAPTDIRLNNEMVVATWHLTPIRRDELLGMCTWNFILKLIAVSCLYLSSLLTGNCPSRFDLCASIFSLSEVFSIFLFSLNLSVNERYFALFVGGVYCDLSV